MCTTRRKATEFPPRVMSSVPFGAPASLLEGSQVVEVVLGVLFIVERLDQFLRLQKVSDTYAHPVCEGTEEVGRNRPFANSDHDQRKIHCDEQEVRT